MLSKMTNTVTVSRDVMIVYLMRAIVNFSTMFENYYLKVGHYLDYMHQETYGGLCFINGMEGQLLVMGYLC